MAAAANLLDATIRELDLLPGEKLCLEVMLGRRLEVRNTTKEQRARCALKLLNNMALADKGITTTSIDVLSKRILPRLLHHLAEALVVKERAYRTERTGAPPVPERPARLVSDENVRASVGRLVAQLQELAERPTVIVAVTRGGAIPAVMLAHSLNIRLFGAVRVWGRGDMESSLAAAIPVIDCIGLPDDRDIRHALIVEDIITTGKSVAAVADVVFSHWPRLDSVTVAGLFVRSAAIEPPDPRVRMFAGERIEDDRWLIFPWERQE